MIENYGVSVSDLLIHPEFKELQRNPPHPKFNDTRTLERVLWELGLDTTQEYTTRECTHRNLQGDVVTCDMYRGRERTDKAWIQSGCASIEATMSSAGSAEMWRELQNIRNRG